MSSEGEGDDAGKADVDSSDVDINAMLEELEVKLQLRDLLYNESMSYQMFRNDSKNLCF